MSTDFIVGFAIGWALADVACCALIFWFMRRGWVQ